MGHMNVALNGHPAPFPPEWANGDPLTAEAFGGCLSVLQAVLRPWVRHIPYVSQPGSGVEMSVSVDYSGAVIGGGGLNIAAGRITLRADGSTANQASWSLPVSHEGQSDNVFGWGIWYDSSAGLHHVVQLRNGWANGAYLWYAYGTTTIQTPALGTGDYLTFTCMWEARD